MTNTTDSTAVRSHITVLQLASNLHLAAFEFSKRKFSSVYGKLLPVWALLASGSTGGVSP